MKSGLIKVYRKSEGWAIIKPDEHGPDVFAHYSAMAEDLKERLQTGMPVLFESMPGPRGLCATKVKQDIMFTWLELPKRCDHRIAVRDERDGTVEVFHEPAQARTWQIIRRGMPI